MSVLTTPFRYNTSLWLPVIPPLRARAVVRCQDDQRVLELARSFKRRNDAADLLVGMRQHARECFHLARHQGLLLGVEAVPRRHSFVALRQHCALRNDAHLELALVNLLAQFAPAHVKLALVTVDVRLGRMMRCVHGARGPEHKEGLLRIDGNVASYIMNGFIGQVFSQVIIRFAS